MAVQPFDETITDVIQPFLSRILARLPAAGCRLDARRASRREPV
jgi:hypothetical protein